MTSISANIPVENEHESGETISSDIQNYLQNFNKEIGEDNQGNGGGNTFYQLDAQVCVLNRFYLIDICIT